MSDDTIADDHALFQEAIFAGDIDAVSSLIATKSIDVNAPLIVANRPTTALFSAAARGLIDLVALLLAANARINDTNYNGATPCHAAARHCRVVLLQLLIERGADLSALDDDGNTPLCLSIQKRHTEAVIMLIDAGAPLWSVCKAAGMSTDVIRALLNRGVDVQSLRDDSFNTPLHCAAMLDGADAERVIDMLVDVVHVDLEARNHSDGFTCCQTAIVFESVRSLRHLLARGIDVDGAGYDGRPPLCIAAELGFAHGVRLLLAAGADCDRLRNFWIGELPTENRDTLMALVAAGVDFDRADYQGRTARTNPMWPEETADELQATRRAIARLRLDFVRARALEVAIGLRTLDLAALELCEILQYACGPMARLVPFHRWWEIATTVKHFNVSASDQ